MNATATQLTFTLNGESIAPQCNPATTLLQYLQQSGRTGTKQGCGDGDCGACTVALIGTDANGKPSYQAVNSCLIPLGSVAGRAIVTVEGIANGSLHPVQAAMVETGGSQCGYCTPGFIMSLFAAYYDGRVDDAAVEGNLCRCTGYLSIRKAAERVTNAQPNDTFAHQLQQADCTPIALHYSSVHEFYRPTSLGEAIALLQQHPDATLVAGATDLGLDMSHSRRTFATLISIEALPELLQIDQTSDRVEIGAAVPLSHIESRLHGVFPALDS
ncbi:MAG: 2Fe-2S iron-sulfur cluster binding domain-containing protein, partial [Microcoleus sp. SIO2G3]|nr:2Fe-2S iron-sulfur cluster binding domain-containing protein [Microcoleus sp. SIO2G3]